MTIKIIGAGFGRTGTSSLKAALETIGFTKCYHLHEIFTYPDHVQVWEDADHGKPINWDTLFRGYQATVDWPGSHFYQALMHHYPNAKVILTVRDPEKWYESARNTIYSAARAFPWWIRWFVPRIRRFDHMLDAIVWNGTFHGKFTDKQYVIDIFNQHNEEVKRTVPPDRLLVYEVKEGWGPLCHFLNVPVPKNQPFPHLNDTAFFQQMIKQRVRTSRFVFGSITVSAVLAGGWMLLRL